MKTCCFTMVAAKREEEVEKTFCCVQSVSFGSLSEDLVRKLLT